MKWKRVPCVLLLLVAVAIQLPAQHSEADRQFFADTKAKAEKSGASAQNILGVCYTT
jgi:hypothetical protein